VTRKWQIRDEGCPGLHPHLAQNKAEKPHGWLQALNRVVCNGERSSGSILFSAFPQELILKLAERTGGKAGSRARPGFTRDSFVPTLPAEPSWLIHSKEEDRNTHSCSSTGMEKSSSTTNKPEQAQAQPSSESLR